MDGSTPQSGRLNPAKLGKIEADINTMSRAQMIELYAEVVFKYIGGG